MRKRKSENIFGEIGFLFLIIALVFLTIILYLDYQDTPYEGEYHGGERVPISEQRPFLFNKRIVFLGDSLTEFGNYPEIVGNKTHMRVIDGGIGGSMITEHIDESYRAFSAVNIVDAIKKGDFTTQLNANEKLTTEREDNNEKALSSLIETDWSKIDFISLLYGTNDYNFGIPIGNINDTSKKTFYGALNYTITSFKEAFPEVEIIIMTPTKRLNSDADGGGSTDVKPNRSGIYFTEYVEAILKIGQKHDLTVIDLYNESGITEEHLIDSVHLSEDGYKIIGEYVASELKKDFN